MPMVPHNYHYFSAFTLLLSPLRIGHAAAPGPWAMTVDEAASHLRRLQSFTDTVHGVMRGALPVPMVLQLMGGEPFAELPALAGLLQAEGGAGAWQVELSTTAAWASSAPVVDEALDRLAGRLSALFIDTSAALLAGDGLARTERLMQACRNRQLGVQLRCAVAAGQDLPRALFALPVMSDDTSLTQVLALHDAAGHALAVSPGAGPPLRRRCAEAFAFTVLPGGAVYPCTPGAGLAGLQIGALDTESVLDILERVRPDAVLRQLRTAGPRGLFDTLQQGPQAALLAPAYLDGCDFHRQALSDPALSGTLRDAAAYARHPAPHPAATPVARPHRPTGRLIPIQLR